MKKVIVNTLGLVILASLIFSCNNDKSMQQFIVNQQEKSDIISVDIPISMLALNEELQDAEAIEALESVKKATILAYQIKDSDNTRYLADKEQLKQILKQNKYAELLRYGKGTEGAKVYMVGEENSIDELIIFANNDSLGWLVLRLLGDDMQPEKIIQLMQKIDLKDSDIDLSQFVDLLKKREGMD